MVNGNIAGNRRVRLRCGVKMDEAYVVGCQRLMLERYFAREKALWSCVHLAKVELCQREEFSRLMMGAG